MAILIAISDDIEARLTSYLVQTIDSDVTITATAAETAQVMTARTWSVIVLDTVLSDGSGFDLLRTLVERGFDGAILFVSNSNDVTVKVRALESGADDYLVRPYEPAELLARIRATTRRSRQQLRHAISDIIRAGALELHINALEVTLPGNRHVQLTPNEMRLLHYLMTNEQRVVGHTELAMRLLRTETHTAGSNVVSVYMRRVRRKIERNPDEPRYIQTVRGRGYRFNGAA